MTCAQVLPDNFFSDYRHSMTKTPSYLNWKIALQSSLIFDRHLLIEIKCYFCHNNTPTIPEVGKYSSCNSLGERELKRKVLLHPPTPRFLYPHYIDSLILSLAQISPSFLHLLFFAFLIFPFYFLCFQHLSSLFSLNFTYFLFFTFNRACMLTL